MFSLSAGTLSPIHPGGRPSRWAATGRWGGVSDGAFSTLNLADYVPDRSDAVAANRAAVADWVAGSGLAVMSAVHGAAVAVVDRPGVVPGVDALVTSTPGLAIAALGADCVPLALTGSDGHTVAVAHCGWRGLVADVVGAVVGVMAQRGVRVEHAVLGASICGRCYPVPQARADEVAQACAGDVAAEALVTCPDGQPGIDVGRGVRARLAHFGVPAARVLVAAGCTAEDRGLFSYRRDSVTGRQAVVIARMGP